MSAHAALKAATREAHDRIDAHFAAYDLSDPKDYAAFLVAHAAAFLPVEAALDQAGAARLLPDWAEYRRSQALVADLNALGLPVPDPVKPPAFPDDAALIGGAYVLEGSRLGAAVLKRAVPPGRSAQFLNAPQPRGRWRQFIAILDETLYSERSLSRAGTSAQAVFACFEQAIMVTRNE